VRHEEQMMLTPSAALTRNMPRDRRVFPS